MALAQDPEELFDVVDVGGNPTGIVKRRADVHRDGDWHRAIHVWVVGESADGPWIMFQRRGLDKDTWPGELDCTVGGHLGAGESVEDAYREIREEIGIEIDPAQLVRVGRRIAINDKPGAYLDREIQEILFLRDERDLLDFHPNPDELDSLVTFPIEPMLDLLARRRDAVVGTRRPVISDEIGPMTLTVDGLMPTTDSYVYRVLVAARNFLRGDTHVAV
jgi:isopentenyldiphosphate isomerase